MPARKLVVVFFETKLSAPVEEEESFTSTSGVSKCTCTITANQFATERIHQSHREPLYAFKFYSDLDENRRKTPQAPTSPHGFEKVRPTGRGRRRYSLLVFFDIHFLLSVLPAALFVYQKSLYPW